MDHFLKYLHGCVIHEIIDFCRTKTIIDHIIHQSIPGQTQPVFHTSIKQQHHIYKHGCCHIIISRPSSPSTTTHSLAKHHHHRHCRVKPSCFFANQPWFHIHFLSMSPLKRPIRFPMGWMLLRYCLHNSPINIGRPQWARSK